ncbi:MAG: hypothetical protein V3S29_00975 [bacterium]
MKTHHWFLVLAVAAIAWVMVRGGEEKFSSASYNYDRVAVSQGLTAQAQALNLEKDLDVALLPDIGKQVIREAAQKGLREQPFLEFAIREVGNRVREISTIDLNGDDIVDPILVKPEPEEGEKYVLLSLQVPAPNAYPLPDAGNSAAWKKVETVEVATMSIALDQDALTVEAQGNRHVYPNAGGNRYVSHDRTSSFLQMYVAMRMTQWMFFPRYYGFWGAGYGYGMYRPMAVPVRAGRRAGAINNRGYRSSSAQRSSAVRTRSGGAPTSRYSRAYSSSPPRSLSQVRSSASFRRRQAGVARSGGFGQGRSSARASSRSFGSSRAVRSSGGFGRGFGRSSFGGGGSRFGK